MYTKSLLLDFLVYAEIIFYAEETLRRDPLLIIVLYVSQYSYRDPLWYDPGVLTV